ncbi:MAG: hypothetical protein JXL80_16960 [Planctomycetes bacterium]|nr:hypothetical protein [Planctomycetota bacterium]
MATSRVWFAGAAVFAIMWSVTVAIGSPQPRDSLSDEQMSLIVGKLDPCTNTQLGIDECDQGDDQDNNPCLDCKQAEGGNQPAVCPHDGNVVEVYSGLTYDSCKLNPVGEFGCNPLGKQNCYRPNKCASNAVVPNASCATNFLCQIPEEPAGAFRCRECKLGTWEGDWVTRDHERCN